VSPWALWHAPPQGMPQWLNPHVLSAMESNWQLVRCRAERARGLCGSDLGAVGGAPGVRVDGVYGDRAREQPAPGCCPPRGRASS
jgi:hypothetical protein